MAEKVVDARDVSVPPNGRTSRLRWPLVLMDAEDVFLPGEKHGNVWRRSLLILNVKTVLKSSTII